MEHRRFGHLNNSDIFKRTTTNKTFWHIRFYKEFKPNGIWQIKQKEKQRDTEAYSYLNLLDKSFGQLVVLGFGVAAFTPAPYQRHSLWRPYKENLSCDRLRA